MQSHLKKHQQKAVYPSLLPFHQPSTIRTWIPIPGCRARRAPRCSPPPSGHEPRGPVESPGGRWRYFDGYGMSTGYPQGYFGGYFG